MSIILRILIIIRMIALVRIIHTYSYVCTFTCNYADDVFSYGFVHMTTIKTLHKKNTHTLNNVCFVKAPEKTHCMCAFCQSFEKKTTHCTMCVCLSKFRKHKQTHCMCVCLCVFVQHLRTKTYIVRCVRCSKI